MRGLRMPDDASNAVKLLPARAQAALRREFAVLLVKAGLLEPARARAIAGMERTPFPALLAQRQVARGGSPEEALEDMRAARAAIPTDRTGSSATSRL